LPEELAQLRLTLAADHHQDTLRQLDRGGLRSLPTFGDADKDALTLSQTRYACPLKRGDMHEDIVSAAIQDDETEPLGGVVPLHGSHLLDARLQGLSV
jgi:hypothetical protein